jgi:hypothetical protein
VAGDPVLRARVEDLRTVREAVAAAPSPPPGAAEAAVVAALEELRAPGRASGRRVRWLTPVTAAAIVLLILVALPLVLIVGNGGGQSDQASRGDSGDSALSDGSGEALEERAPATSETTASNQFAAGGDVGIPNLGPVPDEQSLRLLVGGAKDAASEGAPAPLAPTSGGQRATGPETRVLLDAGGCAHRLRAPDGSSLGVFAYEATLRYQGTDAVVYGYASGAGGRPIRFVVAAGPECTVLARVNL